MMETIYLVANLVKKKEDLSKYMNMKKLTFLYFILYFEDQSKNLHTDFNFEESIFDKV